MRSFIKTLLAAAALSALPMLANAESHYVNGTGNANARLDFQVTVPRFLLLRVGTGSNTATNSTVDLISFTVPATTMGNGTPVAASAGSGDLGNGAVTARVLGNGGAVTLTSATNGALSNGVAGNTISYSQIQTAVTALAGAPGAPMAHPTLADSGTGSVTLPATAGVVDRGATWTYSYANSGIVAPGTYGGVNVNNGRVTYTAATP
ncbi:MAG TPA: hypothetical protein VJ806_06650 [Luteimonas sp.]|nr:hypothetical protein [Luteimonas sp.]